MDMFSFGTHKIMGAGVKNISCMEKQFYGKKKI